MERPDANHWKPGNAPSAPPEALRNRARPDRPCGQWWRQGFRAVLLLAAPVAMARERAAAAPLRVCVVGASGPSFSTEEAREAMSGLVAYISQADEAQCTLVVVAASADTADLAGALKGTDVAVLGIRGPQLAGPAGASLREFLAAGRGLVVLGAVAGAWGDWPEFEPEVLGARNGGVFGAGAVLRIITLFPHPILAGVDHFETSQALYRCELSPDAQVIMEGTVGEETIPLGWVRRVGKSRIVALEPGGRALLGDPDYRRIVANSVRWAAARPVRGARTLVQRTSMADAYPGALAICFPEGPSLCYDTVRGGINYIWDGDFVDLHPWWTGHHGSPLRTFAARIEGEVLYKEQMLTPAMHVGTKDEQSAYHFRGYRLRGDGYPELLYTVGGREVTEDLYAVGDGVGVARSFHVGAGPSPFWLRLADDGRADIAVTGAVRDGNFVRFDAPDRGEFTVTIRKAAGPGP